MRLRPTKNEHSPSSRKEEKYIDGQWWALSGNVQRAWEIAGAAYTEAGGADWATAYRTVILESAMLFSESTGADGGRGGRGGIDWALFRHC